MAQSTRSVPANRRRNILAISALVDSTGTGAFLAIVPVFVVLEVGIDPVAVGMVLGGANLISLLSPIPAGWLTDRYGPASVWTGLLVGRAAGYTCFVFVNSLESYAILLCVLGLLDRASSPVQQVFVLQMEPPDRRSRSMAVLRTARNVGMSAGFLVGGLVISIGTTTAFNTGFIVNAASFLILLAAVRVLSRERNISAPGQGPAAAEAIDRTIALRDRRYIVLATGNAVLLLHDSVLFVLLPLWIISRTDLDPAWIGPLLAVNTVLTVGLQVPLTRWMHSIPTARRMIAWSVLPLVGSTALFFVAESTESGLAVSAVLGAIVLLTVGENMHSVPAFDLSYRLAVDRYMGSYLGLFDFGHAAQLAYGPPLMTLVVLRSPLGWVGLAGAFGTGAALMLLSSSQPEAEYGANEM